MSSCDTAVDLLPVADALTRLLAQTAISTETEQVTLAQALGRVLAQAPLVVADVPPADNSSMDGYAVRLADLNSNSTTSLVQSMRIAAGEDAGVLTLGTCARIFTGAEIPQNADAVVMQEQVQIDGDKIIFPAGVKPQQNIRPQGQAAKTGDPIIAAGTRLNAVDLGLLAAGGCAEVEVYKQLSVAIVCTGNELVAPGQALKPGQIYNANGYFLAGLLESLGMKPVLIGQVLDTLEATEQALLKAAEQADAIISTGGVSVGEEDHIKAAVERLGRLDLWRIKLKPGKPLAYGQVNNVPFFGLPGNPASSLITFCLFARPCLLKQQGADAIEPMQFKVPAAFDYDSGQRQEYLRVRYEEGQLSPFSNQSSGILTAVNWANGLAIIPPQTKVKQGDAVDFMPFSELIN